MGIKSTYKPNQRLGISYNRTRFSKSWTTGKRNSRITPEQLESKKRRILDSYPEVQRGLKRIEQ